MQIKSTLFHGWEGMVGDDTGTEIILDIGAIFMQICITLFSHFAIDGVGK